MSKYSQPSIELRLRGIVKDSVSGDALEDGEGINRIPGWKKNKEVGSHTKKWMNIPKNRELPWASSDLSVHLYGVVPGGWIHASTFLVTLQQCTQRVCSEMPFLIDTGIEVILGECDTFKSETRPSGIFLEKVMPKESGKVEQVLARNCYFSVSATALFSNADYCNEKNRTRQQASWKK